MYKRQVHGSLAALWVPLEYVAIVGLTIGGFVASNDLKIIKTTVGAVSYTHLDVYKRQRRQNASAPTTCANTVSPWR